MYRETPVLIPDSPLITTRKKKSGIYVNYEIDRVYDPARKFNVPVRRGIGKVCDDDPTKMFPNERYFMFFNDVSPVEEELPVETRSCCIKLGAHIIIDKVAQEYQLRKLLEKHFGSRAGLVLDLSAYALIEESNAGQYYPDYAFCHPLFTESMRIFSDSTVSNLLGSEITKDQIQGFLDDWNESRDHRHRIYISYDSTNKNSQAGDIELVEYGKAKENKGLPVFNASVAYDKDNKIPLFYEEYPGSINDMSQFKHFVDKVLEYGYRSVGFILDRGYFSRENIRYMDDNGFNFVMMIKGHKELVSELVRAHAGTFEATFSCYCGQDIYGTTDTAKLFGDDKLRFIHIYFDAGKMAAERHKVSEKIKEMQDWLVLQIGKPVEIPEICERYFTCHFIEKEIKPEGGQRKGKAKLEKQRVLAGVKGKDDVIERELKLCGYFCLVTSEKMTAKEALDLYKSRDASEKLFRADKSFLGARSMRVCSEEALSSKLFVEFIGLIVRNRIYNLLKEEAGKMNKKPNYMTVPAAIKELEKIELIRVGKGSYKLDHALTKHQKIILRSFGISSEDVISKADQVAQQLANAKDPEPCEQDDEEEENAKEINFEIYEFED